MKNRVIFIGKTGCGKTTLCQKLDELTIKYKKTQTVEIYNNAIDTPGEFLENKQYYSAIIVSAVDAEMVAVVADPTVDENFIPPSLAGTFNKEMIGIITKRSIVKDNTLLLKARNALEQAGSSQIFEVDTIYDVGVEDLFKYINDKLRG
ncbi:MAG: ethanolamine utilization protein EutP [Epulopiscium sp. Nuni2H_MBin003]|nr:MAG: ethanolamine utilization protein EutP [Epulopiscium sp. Nuni2H_MBin003]